MVAQIHTVKARRVQTQIEMRSENGRRTEISRGAAAGAVGGMVGSSAMVVFNHLAAAAGFGRDDIRRRPERRAHAKPNDTDGTIADEPASMKAASNVAEAVTGAPLGERGRRVGGPLFHHAFGAIVGALYGAAVARHPRLAATGGAPYGVLVWLIGSEVGVPLAGLSRAPVCYPPSRHIASLSTHVVFGLVLETVRRVMTRR